ncbi:MAG: DUF4157 domain-containing protein, partial [Cyanobacteria bacterium J06642_11]
MPKQVSDAFVQSGYPEVKQARVHVDDVATQSIQAKAYTQKNNIVVQSSGANDPQLLAHEATHVVQQSQMALKPDVNGTPINANPALEQNADDNGDRVVRNQPVSVMGASAQGENGESAPQPSPSVVQSSSFTAQTDLQSGRVGGPSLPQQTNGTIQRTVYPNDYYLYSANEASSYLREETVRSHLLKAGIHEDIIEALVKKYVTGKKNISLNKLLKEAQEENPAKKKKPAKKKNIERRRRKASEMEEKASEIEDTLNDDEEKDALNDNEVNGANAYKRPRRKDKQRRGAANNQDMELLGPVLHLVDLMNRHGKNRADDVDEQSNAMSEASVESSAISALSSATSIGSSLSSAHSSVTSSSSESDDDWLFKPSLSRPNSDPYLPLTKENLDRWDLLNQALKSNSEPFDMTDDESRDNIMAGPSEADIQNNIRQANRESSGISDIERDEEKTDRAVELANAILKRQKNGGEEKFELFESWDQVKADIKNGHFTEKAKQLLEKVAAQEISDDDFHTYRFEISEDDAYILDNQQDEEVFSKNSDKKAADSLFPNLNQEKEKQDEPSAEELIKDYAVASHPDFYQSVVDLLQQNITGLIAQSQSQKKPSERKPLNLIFHATKDADPGGAFFDHETLNSVLGESDSHTLVMMGKSQQEYTNVISSIAKTFGLNCKIDQVMFAGHGSENQIQLNHAAEGDGPANPINY